jgi:hypothetical protein
MKPKDFIISAYLESGSPELLSKVNESNLSKGYHPKTVSGSTPKVSGMGARYEFMSEISG